MGDAGVYDRLRRLKRGPDLPPGDGALEHLEAELAVIPPGGLSLKERLERLVAVAARRQAARVVSSGPVALEELVHGKRAENERGEFFLLEEDLHLERLHGSVPLTRFRALAPGSVAVLTGEPELQGFDLRQAVFLDTETTGLAGGTGTAAFLIGVGWVEGDRFRLRQYFMRDYHEEAALLRGLADDLRGFRHLVTYNGKVFDIPLLEARYRMNRDRYPLADAQHLDLLHPARRLWKARLESCRLQVLESALLGVRRVGDVPGEEIPRIYFDFVRRRDGRAMARVLEHNRLDVLSLAALAALACQWIEGGHAEDPLDVYCLARVLERAEHFDRSEEEYRRVAASDDAGPVRIASLLRLAARAKRRGDLTTAVPLWQEAAGEGDVHALRELALHHEHRTRDLPAALEAVDRGLEELEEEDGVPWTLAADLRRRRERLVSKLARS